MTSIKKPLLLLILTWILSGFLFQLHGADSVAVQEATSDSSTAIDSLAEPTVSEYPPGSPDWEKDQLERLTSENDSLIELAVTEFVSAFRQEEYALLHALANGSLFMDGEGTGGSNLVITGEEVETEDGYYHVPLFTAHPQKKPILEGGDPLMKSTDDLIEVESNRVIRGIIQEYLDKMDLFSPDDKVRRIAAENIGNVGDSTVLDLLKESIDNEKNKSVLRLKQVSLAKIQLTSSDKFERIKAVRLFGEIKSPLAIPVLKKALGQEGSDPGEEDEEIRKEMAKVLDRLKQFQFFMDLVQTGFAGISLGSILILVALGLAIIYGLMGVINMAHGEFMMIGAYTTFIVQNFCIKMLPPERLDWFFVLALPCSFLVAGFIGWLMELLIIRHLYKRPLESLLATWGVSLLLIQSARSIFGDLTAVQLPSYLSGGFEVAPQVIFPFSRIFIICFTAVVVLCLMILFYRTSFGLKLRAVTQNRTMSSCVGIGVRKVDSLTFFLGTGIAGIAGWAMTLIGNVVPNMGETYIVDSFLVVVTGGVGNLLGTISAGLGIGVISKAAEPVLQAVYGKVFILALIILFLQIRPSGLFANKSRGHEN